MTLRARLQTALQQPVRDRPVLPRESVTERDDLAGLGGRWFETRLGPAYVIESVYESGHLHGSVPLHRALTLNLGTIAQQCREPRLATCDPRRLLFIDTETTGLAGAGAMVFLTGVAQFVGGCLRLRQYLLPSPEYEVGVLGELADEIAGAGALVSYNGKSFDLPMLESRYVLARLEPRLRDIPHLDLLHPNRRLFRGSLPSHRLVELETALLDFEREDDCPSHEVPLRYIAFQRTGDPTHIRPVLRHNAWDVLSLVALTAQLAAACAGESGPLQAARAAAYAGDLARAAERYEAVVAEGASRAERLEAMEVAARCHQRLKQYEAAATLWRALIAEPRARRLTPYVELAKILEHRQHDIEGALALIEEATTLVRRGLLRPGSSAAGVDVAALEHRHERLLRKRERQLKNAAAAPRGS